MRREINLVRRPTRQAGTAGNIRRVEDSGPAESLPGGWERKHKKVSKRCRQAIKDVGITRGPLKNNHLIT